MPAGLAVSLPAGSACQRKCCVIDALVLLLKDAASRSNGLEVAPAVAVAALLAFMVKVLRSMAVPFTSSVAAGVVVPIPTLPPDSKMAEGSIAHAAVNLATWFALAVPSLVTAVQALSGETSRAASGFAPETIAAVARRNAEGGSPPRVSASPAFKAYGALTSITRVCSACPSTVAPSQWACRVVNKSAGRPAGLVAPRKTP